MPQSTQDLLNSYARELILLAGKDGTGKSSAVVSMAALVEIVSPEAKFYVMDTENKFAAAVRSFGSDAPQNLVYYKTDDMNQITAALREVLEAYQPGDWLAVESEARVWERAQDLAYNTIAGVTKAEYLRSKEKKAGPIPSPDDFWKIAKGAHDGAFIDPITSRNDLNCIMTTIAKPAKDSGFLKDSAERKAFRVETGFDANLGGPPSLPSYFHTVGILELNGGRVTSRILRDNNSSRENTRPEFEVPDRASWAQAFWAEAR